jgi:hypothetical protein
LRSLQEPALSLSKGWGAMLPAQLLSVLHKPRCDAVVVPALREEHEGRGTRQILAHELSILRRRLHRPRARSREIGKARRVSLLLAHLSGHVVAELLLDLLLGLGIEVG